MSGRNDEPEFYSIFLFLYFFCLGTTISGDLFTFFIFYESVVITVALISLFSRTSPAIVASGKYVRMASIGSSFFVFSVALIYGSTGTLNIQILSSQISKIDPKVSLLIQSLLMVSFGIESALFPLHFWLPDLHENALAPVYSALSGVVVTVGVYAFSRFMPLIFPTNEWWWKETLFFISFLSITLPNLLAFMQDNFKRLLAYSTIFNLGLSTILISIGSKIAVEAMLIQLLAHALAKSSLFLISGFFSKEFSTLSLSKLRLVKIPLSIKVFTLISTFSLMGFPFTLGFFSKYYLLSAIFSSNVQLYAATFLIVFVSLTLSFPYYFKVLNFLVFSNSKNNEVKVPWYMFLSILLLNLLLIVLPLFLDKIVVD